MDKLNRISQDIMLALGLNQDLLKLLYYKDKDVDLKTPVTKADTSAILNHLGKTREILVKKLDAQKNEKVKEFLNEVIIGIDEAINAAKDLNGEVNNNSTPSN